MLYKLLYILLATQIQATSADETLSGVHIKGPAAKINIGGCSIELNGDKLKSSCPIDMPTTTAGPTTTGGVGHFDSLQLAGTEYHDPVETEGIALDTVVTKAQYEIEWEIKWHESDNPPTMASSYPPFYHTGTVDGDRVPALWLQAIGGFYWAPNDDYHHANLPSDVAWEAGKEYKLSMSMMNDAGTGNTGCKAKLKLTPLETGVEYELKSVDYPNCLTDVGSSHPVYVVDPWYGKPHHSTRNLRYRYFD
jgi:hypothetical protein